MQTFSSESCVTVTAAMAAGQATSRANTAAIALPGQQQVRTAALRDAVTAGTKSPAVHVEARQHMVTAHDHPQWGQGSYLGMPGVQDSYLGGSWAPGAVGRAQLISKVVAQHNPWPLITGRGNAADWAALRQEHWAGLRTRKRQCTPPWHPTVFWIDAHAYPGPSSAPHAAGIHPPGARLGPAPAKIYLRLFFLPSRGRWPDSLTPAQGAGPGPPIPQGPCESL